MPELYFLFIPLGIEPDNFRYVADLLTVSTVKQLHQLEYRFGRVLVPPN